MVKSAFLIISHGNFEMLKFLIKSLDYANNDVYVHIDKKYGIIDYSEFKDLTQFSKLKFLGDRVSVSWGGVSLVKCTLLLMEEAMKGGEYDYFHLISGVDFPLQSNEKLEKFLEEHLGKEFVGFTHNTQDLSYKIGYYHLFNDGILKKFPYANKIHTLLLKLQKFFNIRRYYDISNFCKGCNWWSITGQLANSILKEKNSIVKRYKYSSCSDETFLQTFVKEHPIFLKDVYCLSDEYKGCMRLIDWNRGTPYVYTLNDIKELRDSKRFFARKIENVQVMKKIQEIRG